MSQDVLHLKLQRAFQQLRWPLFHFLRRRLGNPSDAEDMVQESFARWAAAERDGIVAERPQQFVFQIAANLACDHGRRARRRGDVFVETHGADLEDGQEDVEADDAANPAVFAEHRQTIALLAQALAELPERQREALLLSRFEGLTQDQIALRMGISRRMVVRHLSAALAYCELRTHYRD